MLSTSQLPTTALRNQRRYDTQQRKNINRPRFGLLSDNITTLDNDWNVFTSTRRRSRRVTKNCKNLRRYGYSYIGFRHQQHTSRERYMVEALTLQVMQLERRRALLESVDLARYANIRQHAMNSIDSYYGHFKYGYHSSQDYSLESIIRSLLSEDCTSPAFLNVDMFLRQWVNYIEYHESVRITLHSIQEVMDIDSNAIVIQCNGLTTFRISRATIQHFFKPILSDEALVQQLIGKEYSFPFCSLFYYDETRGKVTRMEPRAELASGLLNLISDPFTTVKLLGASRLTAEGCLHVHDDSQDTVNN